MDTKVGEYIHAHLQNYKMYGITKNTKNDASYNFAKYINDRVKDITNKTPNRENDISDIQNEINTLIKKQLQTDDQTEALRKIILNVMKEKFDYNMKKYNVDWKYGDLTTLEGLEVITPLQQPKEGTNRDLSRLQERIELINNHIDQLINLKTAKELKKEIKEIKQIVLDSVKNIEQELDSFIKEYGISNNKVLIGADQKTTDLFNIEKKLNDVIQTYITIPATGLIKGDFFEALSAAAMLKAKGVAADKLKKSIKDAIVGTTGKSAILIPLDKFSTEVQKALSSQLKDFTFQGENNTLVSTHQSQNKVDVKITWGVDKTIRASIKNIQLSNGIHIVSETSLLTVFLNEDNTMINHYLNIASSHVDGLSSMRVSAHKKIELLIAVKALVGHKPNEEFAELFIVNNNNSSATNSIYIITMADMIKKLQQHQELYTVTNQDQQPFESIVFNNNFVGNNLNEKDGLTRIGNLLLDVYNTKVSVVLTQNAVK